MSSAIERQNVITDDALQAPLILTQNLETALKAMKEFIALTKSSQGKLVDATSIQEARTAVAELTEEQKQLAKVQNQIATAVAKDSDEYRRLNETLKNTNASLKTKAALGDKEAASITRQNASLEQLRAALNANKVAYAKLATEEQRASAEGQKLLKTIQNQDKAVKDLSKDIGQNSVFVGEYERGNKGVADSLQAIAPAATNAATGIKAMTLAGLQFIMTPIGAVIALIAAGLFALMSYFKGSEEGQDRLNKIMAVGHAVFEQFMNVVEAVGKALFEAFANPKQALIDFGNFLKSQIVNRFEGLIELIPQLGKAIGLLFAGEFKKAGQVAFDAAAKVGLGVENATAKISAMIDETKKLVDTGVKYGQAIAKLQAQIDRENRKLIVDRAKSDLEVAKLREKAVTLEGDAKKKAIEEAIKMEQELSDREVAFAKMNLQMAKLKVKANGDDKEALLEVAEARADVLRAEKMAFDNTLKFRKQLEALDEKELKKTKDEEAVKKKLAQIEAEYNKRAIEEINKVKQAAIDANLTKEQSDKNLNEVRKKLSIQFASEQVQALEAILVAEELTAEERAMVDKEMFRLKTELTDAYYNNLQEKDAEAYAELEKNLETAFEIYSMFAQSIGDLFASFRDRRMMALEEDMMQLEDNHARELELAGNSAAEKARIDNEFAVKKAAIEKKQLEERRKAAIFDKAMSAVQAAIGVSLAVVKAGVITPLAIATAIAGAIQVAAILAKPIPAFKDGTDFHFGGLAILGDGGKSELAVTPSGDLILSPATPTLMDLERGSKVFSGEKTMALAMSGLGGQLDTTPGKDRSFEILSSEVRRLTRTVKNKKEMHINFSRAGAEAVMSKAESRQYYLNNFYA